MKLSSDKLVKLVQSIDYFSHTDMVSSEANTKKKIVEPLLEVLGWDLLSREVRLEHPIRVGTSSGHADYALMLEGKIVVLVEAKAFDTDLSPEYSSQIISYGRVEDVRWVVLTNGRLLKVFDAKAGRSEKECLVTEIDLKDAQTRATDLNLVSRESVLTGEIESTIKRLAATKQAILNLKQNRQEVSNEFKKTLVKVAGVEVETRAENIARRLTDEAIESFEKETQAPHEQGFSKEVRLVARRSLVSKPTGEVVLCPSRIEGVEFLIKYNAWGFVKLSKLDVPYFALYVGRPESSVLYFGEIESITQPLKSRQDLVKMHEEDIETFEPGKRVIHLKSGTLVKLEDPIPLHNKKLAPRNLKYTLLERLIQAKNTDELFG
jgi:predicted type IV restriction endonuclease